jgi:LemA protein
MTGWIVVSALVAMCLIFAALLAGVYNRLVELKATCENGFSQIEVQLKRRYDLIPNLVECVKGYLAHERETLERVIAARNQAAAGLRQAVQQPDDPAALQKWIGAEGTLAGELGRLTLVIENYPELKGNAAVADLTEQLTHTENRIAYARQAYNDWVTGFNTYRETFPTCLFAKPFGFGSNRELLEFADAEKLTEAPSVVLV